MALKGLTKSAQESKSTDQKIEDFISGSTKRIKNLECSQQVYRRFTFSLTEEVSKEIDDLLIDARVAKANRSVILETRFVPGNAQITLAVNVLLLSEKTFRLLLFSTIKYEPSKRKFGVLL